ncbi:MAG: zinc ribbon domain-containing protein [Actinobacteria bacterium]|nr:zinc ribbon domain-containing protein [Actinomycetota bacterium]
MRCPKCKAENPDDATYCSLCYTRFVPTERSRKAEEEAERLRREHGGRKLRCPNCGELSPVDSPFCLRCAFVFEEPESLLVDEEEWRRQEAEENEELRREMEYLHENPIEVMDGEGGAEVMRRVEGIISAGDRAHLRARGRVGITHAMKIIALLGEDLRRKGQDLVLKVYLLSEEALKDLDDLELGITMKCEGEGRH